MSLRIKIPPAVRELPPPSRAEEPMEGPASGKSLRNRKRPKRYIEDDESPEPERKMARTSTAGKTRKQSTAEPDPNVEDSSPPADVEVDVVMNVTNDEPEKGVEGHHSEHSAERSTTSAKAQPKSTKSKGKAHVPAPPPKKKIQKRNVVVSDSEDEDDYMDVTLDVVAEDDDEEDYYSPEEKSAKAFKGKGKASTAKSTAGKRKAKAEPSETGHSGTDKKSGGLSTTTKKAKIPSKHEETPIDVVGEFAAEVSVSIERVSPATTNQESPMPTAVPKKPKLPTIKKTKLPSTPSVNTPLSATSSTSKLPLELGLNSKLNHGGIRKTLINKTDVDLSNKSIYQEIFLKTSGESGTPRRTKEDERRKELNRMRDEYKAKRMEETRHSFDLQAQYDKISRFEDKLKAGRSSALWPNFLGAKWREEYEREKFRRQKEDQWQGVPMEGREEGEVH